MAGVEGEAVSCGEGLVRAPRASARIGMREGSEARRGRGVGKVIGRYLGGRRARRRWGKGWP